MAENFSFSVTGHYSTDGEYWRVDLLDDGVLVARVDRMRTCADARRAGEFLLFGAKTDWSVLHSFSNEVIKAGVDALEQPAPEIYGAEVQPPESQRHVRSIVGAVLLAAVREVLYQPQPAAAEATKG